ncbi:MAG: hypothetical protein EZS28_040658 [Streblomastix strix]|uniref:Uncharacterized protein n=1 Tax=Streblomastix strix TaxID=222440 RepID=A0A5J4U2F6_9EUKA|nr:MAG: hypothetical protein EZS28_040658 [Streblomastix strix]
MPNSHQYHIKILIGTAQGTVENYETTINQQQYDKIEIQKQQIVIATASKLKSVVILRDSPIEYLDVIVEQQIHVTRICSGCKGLYFVLSKEDLKVEQVLLAGDGTEDVDQLMQIVRDASHAGPQFSKAIQKLNELSEHDKYIFTFSDQPQVLVSQSGICDVLPITEQSQNNSSTLEDLISPLNANNTELTDKVQLSLSQTLDIKGLLSPKSPRSIMSPNQIDQSIFGEHQLDEITEDESEFGQAVAALKIERELRLSLEGKNQEMQQELNKLRIYHCELMKETQHLRENYLIEHLQKVKIQTEAKQAQFRSKQQLICCMESWNQHTKRQFYWTS